MFLGVACLVYLVCIVLSMIMNNIDSRDGQWSGLDSNILHVVGIT